MSWFISKMGKQIDKTMNPTRSHHRIMTGSTIGGQPHNSWFPPHFKNIGNLVKHFFKLAGTVLPPGSSGWRAWGTPGRRKGEPEALALADFFGCLRPPCRRSEHCPTMLRTNVQGDQQEVTPFSSRDPRVRLSERPPSLRARLPTPGSLRTVVSHQRRPFGFCGGAATARPPTASSSRTAHQ